jgi:hypothetical protein
MGAAAPPVTSASADRRGSSNAGVDDRRSM